MLNIFELEYQINQQMGLLLKFSLILSLLLGPNLSQISKKEFYEHFSVSDEKTINLALDLVNNSALKERFAYSGALLMRKAGIVGSPKEKLDLFKQGRRKLETEIEKEKDNAEYRFLRLMIQENAPSILGYKNDIKEDKGFLISHYKSLDPAVKTAILNYCQNSHILTKEDFQN